MSAAWSWISDYRLGLKAASVLAGWEASSLARLIAGCIRRWRIFVSYWVLHAEGDALKAQYHTACS
jgi:hypothetical protein